VDLASVVRRKDAIVESFRSGQQRKVDSRESLDLYRGHGRFVSPRRIEINGQTIESKRIFINTGTRSDIPKIDGMGSVPYLTNSAIMELQQVPEHLMVLGGGYIGLEFGQMFRRFGSNVTVVHRDDQLLTREDADVVKELQSSLEAEGVEFVMNATTRSVQRSKGGISLEVDAPSLPSRTPSTLPSRNISGSHLLIATGRRPNTDDLGLEHAGVETDERGFVKVNRRLETNVPGIWALGDVKGGPAFTHISYNDFQVLYANVIEGKDEGIDKRIVPYSVFTDPQLGRVGMTETEARAKGYKLKIGKIPMSWVARAIERDETAGVMKLVVDATTDRVLGAAILALEGGELVQMLGVLMLANLPYTLLKGAIYIHPTLAEGFFTLMEEVKPT
jgi:pyruvate/2-oxoglutarate dehydrogenase complex dihydrolipoamide dehydrogenase (E3) component